MTERPLLIYDGDCAFCTRCVRWVERLPVQVPLVPWQETDLAAFRVTEARARHELLWVDASGRVSGGAAAVAELLAHCRMPWRPLGLLLAAPLVRNVAEGTYRWVARNRHRFPGATPACQLPPAQRPGARRP